MALWISRSRSRINETRTKLGAWWLQLSSRILLVDDHEVVRKGIATLLMTRWDVCGEASDGLEAVSKTAELKPDLVILDLSMPVMSGTAAARRIRSLMPSTKIMFLSMHDSGTVAELTRLAGADACISKRCSAAELHRVIAAVLDGKEEENRCGPDRRC